MILLLTVQGLGMEEKSAAVIALAARAADVMSFLRSRNVGSSGMSPVTPAAAPIGDDATVGDPAGSPDSRLEETPAASSGVDAASVSGLARPSELEEKATGSAQQDGCGWFDTGPAAVSADSGGDEAAEFERVSMTIEEQCEQSTSDPNVVKGGLDRGQVSQTFMPTSSEAGW